jgi:hypothetical protein
VTDKCFKNRDEEKKARQKLSAERKSLINAYTVAGLTPEQIELVLDIQADAFRSAPKTDIELAEDFDRGKIRYLGELTTPEAKWIPDLDQIENLAKRGLDDKHIAGELGLSADMFARKKLEFPEIDIRINRGQGRTTFDVADALIKMATIKHNPLAAIFLSKTIGRFNDQPVKVQHEHSGEVNVNARHVFVAPEMLQEDAFQKMIEDHKAKVTVKAIAADADVIDVEDMSTGGDDNGDE